jgi:pyrimidine-nucleoside phosphorylase
MNSLEIVAKKRDGKVLTSEEIEFIVSEYLKGGVSPSQFSAFLMAIYLRGMKFSEIFSLTKSYIFSGEKIDLSCIEGLKADKHSTGGIGDKTTLVVGPIVAACGIPFAKLAGRSLGITGGTIDKLESIPNFKTELSKDEFIEQLKKIKIIISSPTEYLVPADKKIYTLREITATVESIPLIAASVMSKKIAGGSDIIVLDIKVGSGAFLKEINTAKELANIMIKIGKKFKKKIVCILTDMEQPLGYAVGNILEVKEAINTLKGKGPKDLLELSLAISSYIFLISGYSKSLEDAKKKAEKLIQEGVAFEKFKEMVSFQGGEVKFIEDLSLFEKSNIEKEIKSEKRGFIHKVDAKKIGEASLILGAGRFKEGEEIDRKVGILLNKKVGDRVEKGEKLCTIFSQNLEKLKIAEEKVKSAFLIRNYRINPAPLIKKVIF